MNNLKEIIVPLKEKAKDFSILFVEDEVQLQEQMVTFLKKIFDTVDVASDGKEALEKYQNKKYDIVITDINMPNMDGFSLIENIFKTNPTQEIIIASAYTEKGYLQKAKELGIPDYVSKPVKLDELLMILYKYANKITESDD